MYGISFKVERELGEPSFRTCGTKVEQISLIENFIWSDVKNKHNPITLRNGRFLYLGASEVNVGTMNIGSDCAPGDRHNEFVSNAVIENNLLQNLHLQIKESTRGIRISNNLILHRKLSDPMPSVRFFAIELKRRPCH